MVAFEAVFAPRLGTSDVFTEGFTCGLLSLTALLGALPDNFFVAAAREETGVAFLVIVGMAFFLPGTLEAMMVFFLPIVLGVAASFVTKVLSNGFLDTVLEADFWRGEVLTDLLRSCLGDRFGAAGGDARRDFVRLESCSLIAKTLSIKENYHRKTINTEPANSDKSIINNRLA